MNHLCEVRFDPCILLFRYRDGETGEKQDLKSFYGGHIPGIDQIAAMHLVEGIRKDISAFTHGIIAGNNAVQTDDVCFLTHAFHI